MTRDDIFATMMESKYLKTNFPLQSGVCCIYCNEYSKITDDKIYKIEKILYNLYKEMNEVGDKIDTLYRDMYYDFDYHTIVTDNFGVLDLYILKDTDVDNIHNEEEFNTYRELCAKFLTYLNILNCIRIKP